VLSAAAQTRGILSIQDLSPCDASLNPSRVLLFILLVSLKARYRLATGVFIRSNVHLPILTSWVLNLK
jgi:hypothetical protein